MRDKRQRLGSTARNPINIDYPNLNLHNKRKHDDEFLERGWTAFRMALYWESRRRWV